MQCDLLLFKQLYIPIDFLLFINVLSSLFFFLFFAKMHTHATSGNEPVPIFVSPKKKLFIYNTRYKKVNMYVNSSPVLL